MAILSGDSWQPWSVSTGGWGELQWRDDGAGIRLTKASGKEQPGPSEVGRLACPPHFLAFAKLYAFVIHLHATVAPGPTQHFPTYFGQREVRFIFLFLAFGACLIHWLAFFVLLCSRVLAMTHGQAYTFWKCSCLAPKLRSIMSKAKSSSRIVIIAGTDSTKKKTVRRKLPKQQLSNSCRIALIRHGELVSGKLNG